MRFWKMLGLAGVAAVGTTTAAIVARRRHWQNYDAEELRKRLHERVHQAVVDKPQPDNQQS